MVLVPELLDARSLKLHVALSRDGGMPRWRICNTPVTEGSTSIHVYECDSWQALPTLARLVPTMSGRLVGRTLSQCAGGLRLISDMGMIVLAHVI